MQTTLPTLEKQKEIAAILSAADKEIEATEAKLAQLKQEKKRLMQELIGDKGTQQ